MAKKTGNKNREGNLYDRIFKENAEALFIPLIEQELNFKIKSYKALQEKIAKTIEREMDFFYRVITEEDKELLLHIEFQTENDKEMIYRMSEYHGLAFRKYKLPIKHIVIFLGKGKTDMKKELEGKEIFDGFDLISLHKLNTTQLLSSQIPEVILLALLSNYEKEQTESILRLLVRQLKAVCRSEQELSKYLQQLTILSRLRKLEEETTKIIADMPITYDIEQDYLYKQGIEKGIEKEKINSIKALLNLQNFSLKQIADILNVSIEKVKEVAKGIED